MTELEPESSQSYLENARKIESIILRALSSVTQTKVAERVAVSDTTISRDIKEVSAIARLIAGCGLKVVPAKYKCLDPEKAKAMMTIYEAAMNRIPNTVELLFGDEE